MPPIIHNPAVSSSSLDKCDAKARTGPVIKQEVTTINLRAADIHQSLSSNKRKRAEEQGQSMTDVQHTLPLRSGPSNTLRNASVGATELITRDTHSLESRLQPDEESHPRIRLGPVGTATSAVIKVGHLTCPASDPCVVTAQAGESRAVHGASTPPSISISAGRLDSRSSVESNQTEKSMDIDPITPAKQDGPKQPPYELEDTDISLPGTSATVSSIKDLPDRFTPAVPLHLIRRYFSPVYLSKMDPYSGVPLIGTDHAMRRRMLFVAKGLNFEMSTAPGKDGLLLSNVTQMNDPEEMAVWAEDSRSDWIYYGQYVATRSDGHLSKEEFSRLPECARTGPT